MNFDDLKANLDKSLQQVNDKMLEQERSRHDEFLNKHFEKYDVLSEKASSSISQLMTLEGVMFAAIVILSNPEHATLWLFLGISSILVSLFFGVWSQKISIQSMYQSHEDGYYQELKNNWWKRELWGDKTIAAEKELIEPHIKDLENSYKKTYSYKILNLFRLNADRIENIFRGAFMLSILLLIIHFIVISS